MRIKQAGNIDRLGIVMSIACAIHCMLLPFLTIFSTVGVLSIIQSSWFEWGVVVLAIVIAYKSLGDGIRTHRKMLPLMLAILGFTCIGIGLYFFHSHPIQTKELFFFHKFPIERQTSIAEVIYMFSGGILIAMAHFVNWRLLKSFHFGFVEKHDQIEETYPKLSI